MKIAYFNCFAGIRGEKILASLVDAGLDWELVKSELVKLPNLDYDLTLEKVRKNGISCTKVNVFPKMEHDNPLKSSKDIQQVVISSELTLEIKEKSLSILTCLIQAMAKVQGKMPDEVCFEVQEGLDSLIYIVGTAIGLSQLGIEEVYSSSINTGNGYLVSKDGIMPIPNPITLELLKGIPIFSQDSKDELVSPLGAAIIKAYAKEFGDLPIMKVISTGCGAGQMDLARPDYLQVTIGEKVEKAGEQHKVGLCTESLNHGLIRFGGQGETREGKALMLETNIDNMNPEFYEHIINKLLKEGAMDAYLQPIQMKKNRPASILTVQISPEKLDKFTDLIFSETTSIGLRVYPITKYMLPYEIKTIDTTLGQARIKISRLNNKVNTISPEYEDCKQLAEENGVALKKVYDMVKQEAYRLIDS